MTLTFKTLPPSTNHLYGQRGGARFLLSKVRDYKDAIAWEARSQYRGEPLAGPLKVEIDLYWPDRRKHDIDNLKALLDALSGVIWVDDGQIIDLHTRKHFDKAAPGVGLSVFPVATDSRRA